jgi:hypothetical protein
MTKNLFAALPVKSLTKMVDNVVLSPQMVRLAATNKSA